MRWLVLVAICCAVPAYGADTTAFMGLGSPPAIIAVSPTLTTTPVTEPVGATSARLVNPLPCDVMIGGNGIMVTHLARSVEVLSIVRSSAISTQTIPTVSTYGVTTPACSGTIEIEFGTGE